MRVNAVHHERSSGMTLNGNGLELSDLAWQGKACAGGPVRVTEGDRP